MSPEEAERDRLIEGMVATGRIDEGAIDLLCVDDDEETQLENLRRLAAQVEGNPGRLWI